MDTWENNLNNFYNKTQRFARISPLRGPCRPRVVARETTMNNASPWTRFLLVVLAKLFHFMAPFLAMAKLERARFCSWLTESVVTCYKGCICCFPLLSRKTCPLFFLTQQEDIPVVFPYSVGADYPTSEDEVEAEADAPLGDARIGRVGEAADVVDLKHLEDVVDAHDQFEVGLVGHDVRPLGQLP